MTKVVVLLGGILIVRLLGVEDYATYTLINNAFSMLTILGDLGVSSALFQFLVEKRNDEEEYNNYLKYGIRCSIFAGLISGLLILLSPLFYPYRSNEIRYYTLIMCLLPLMSALFNVVCMILRANEENKKYSIYQVINAISHYSFIVVLILIFALPGSIFSQYISIAVTLIVGLFILYKSKLISINKKVKKIKRDSSKKFLKLAIGTQLSQITSTLLYSLDIFVISQMIVDTNEIAIYKVATVIPNALAFLPACLMIYSLPSFIKNRNNKQMIYSKTKKIIKYGFLVYFSIFAISCLLSKPIFLLLYGEHYIEARYSFMILMLGFLFNATIRVPIGNIFGALKKPHLNTIINIICLILNVIFNIIFVKWFGYIGAAITTTSILIITSIIYYVIFRRVVNKIDKVVIE